MRFSTRDWRGDCYVQSVRCVTEMSEQPLALGEAAPHAPPDMAFGTAGFAESESCSHRTFLVQCVR